MCARLANQVKNGLVFLGIHADELRPLIRILDLAKGEKDPQLVLDDLEEDALLVFMKNVLKSVNDIITGNVLVEGRGMNETRQRFKHNTLLMTGPVPMFEELFVVACREMGLLEELVAGIGVDTLT